MSRILLTILLTTGFLNSKFYHREFYDTGKLKAQGWFIDFNKEMYWTYFYENGKIMESGSYKSNLRDGYWYFYSKDGKLEMEGHFNKNQKVKWWLFYDENEKINHKCQLKDGVKNGYCLKYRNEELTSAEKFKDGKKVKEWFSFASFKKENKLSDLK